MRSICAPNNSMAARLNRIPAAMRINETTRPTTNSCVAASSPSRVRRAPQSWAMSTLAPTERPETRVVAMNASSCPNPTAAIEVAPKPPTRNTATIPSARCRRLLTVTGRASVSTDLRIRGRDPIGSILAEARPFLGRQIGERFDRVFFIVTEPNLPFSSATAARLSKSKFLAGVQCLKRIYLEVHSPQLASPPDASTQAMLDMGIEIGELARSLFPGGVFIGESHRQREAALARTISVINDLAVPAIFEGAFEHDAVLVRVDILERIDGQPVERATWRLI